MRLAYNGPRLAIYAMALLLLIVGCGKKNDAPSAQKKVTVLAVLPLTGFAAEFGNYYSSALDVLCHEYATRAGVTAKIVILDSKSTPKDGIAAYQQFMGLNPKPDFLFCELSSVCLALAPRSADDSIPMFAVATAPDLCNYKNVVRVYPTPDQLADCFLGHAAFSNTVPLKISVLHYNDDYGRSIGKALSDRLGNMTNLSTSIEEYSASVDPKNLAAKHASSDIGILIGLGQPLGNLIREMRSANPNQIILVPPEADFSAVKKLIVLPDEKIYFLSFPPLANDVQSLFFQKTKRNMNALDNLVHDGVALAFTPTLGSPEVKSAINFRGSSITVSGRSLSVDTNGAVKYMLRLEPLK
jgi:ABC-type branched-subunit amino acid transport system substrate-binding protein